MSKIYLDEKGYEQYLKEIDEIKEKIRKNSADIAEYQSDDAYGDGWHDNFAYEQAMIKERTLMYELDNKMKGLNNIEIVKTKNKTDYVDIGCVVEIQFDNEEETEKYIISGGTTSKIDDTIPTITLNSPLGKAIYKKKINDIFTYEIDKKEYKGKIINITKNN